MMYDSKVCNNHFAKGTTNCMGDDGASVVVLYSEEYWGEVLEGCSDMPVSSSWDKGWAALRFH